MRLAIVEDELVVARRLERMVRAILGEQVESVVVAPTIGAARELLDGAAIDLLFLDLNLNGKDGFRLLEEVTPRSFQTVVVSAYHDQALAAFDYGVTDFVAKPWTEERLRRAIARAAGAEATFSGMARRLAVRKGTAVVFAPVEEVSYVAGADDYSELHMVDGTAMLCDKRLVTLERILPPTFARVHRSYIANLEQVRALRPTEGRPVLSMRDGTSVPVGRRYARLLRARLAIDTDL